MKALILLCSIIFFAILPSNAQKLTGGIVLPGNAAPIEKYAALELQRYLFQVTGEKLVIQTDATKVKPGSFILQQVSGKAGPQGSR